MNGPVSTFIPAEEVALAEEAAPPQARPDDEWTVVSVTAVGHLLCHMAEMVFAGAMLPVMSEFRLLPEQATALALLGFVLMGAGALPVGVWTDAWGPGRVLRIYFAAVALASLVVALSTSVWMLFAALTLLGLALSIYHPAGLALISMGVRARGRALGIHGVAGSIGLSLGPLLGMLCASVGHWRLAYVVVALVATLAGVWLLKSKRLTAFAQPPAAPAPAPTSSGGFRLAAWLPLILMMAAMTIGGFNYRAFTMALPTYLSGETASRDALLTGGALVTLRMIVGGVGQYLGGWGADRYGARGIYFLLVGMYAPAAFVLGLLEGMPLAAAVACLVAFCQFAQQPVENVLLADYTSDRRRGLSYAAKFALTFGVGAAGAVAVGFLWEHYTLGSVFTMIAATSFLMACLLAAALLMRNPQ